jgi:uncharacterized protein (DUF58 family)
LREQEIPIQQIISYVKHLEIKARKLIEDTLISEYHSVFKGKGIEFHETRQYQIGDDIRDIDWNVTARMNEPYIKTYIEERQLSVIFAVDVSSSTYFGTHKSKRQRMAEVVALLGFTSFFNNDRAGLVLFSKEIEKYVPPKKNYSHLLRIIRDSWYYQPVYKTTSLSGSLKEINELFKKRVVIFLLSDFLDSGYEKQLISLSKKHDLIPVVIHDKLEEEIVLKQNGKKFEFLNKLPVFLEFEDSELNLSDSVFYTGTYVSNLEKYRNYYISLFKKLQLDFVELYTDDNFKPIELMLKKRMYRIRM